MTHNMGGVHTQDINRNWWILTNDTHHYIVSNYATILTVSNIVRVTLFIDH